MKIIRIDKIADNQIDNKINNNQANNQAEFVTFVQAFLTLQKTV